MIAIQEFPESKGVEEDKDHAKNKTKQQNSSVVGAKDEDDGDLSKIISDPSIHGFFDFRSQKFLKKINVTSNGLTTGTKANLVRKSTISEINSFNGQSSNPETSKNLNLEGVLPNDFFAAHDIHPKIYRIEVAADQGNDQGDGDASTAIGGARGSQTGNLSAKFGHQNKAGEDQHQVQVAEVHPGLRAGHTVSPKEPALGNPISEENTTSIKDLNGGRPPISEIAPKNDSATFNLNLSHEGSLYQDQKVEEQETPRTRVSQPFSNQANRANPRPKKNAKAKEPSSKQTLTQYENLTVKFAEFLEMGEYKRAQQLNNQSSKIWGNRQQYFIFNYALQSLV